MCIKFEHAESDQARNWRDRFHRPPWKIQSVTPAGNLGQTSQASACARVTQSYKSFDLLSLRSHSGIRRTVPFLHGNASAHGVEWILSTQGERSVLSKVISEFKTMVCEPPEHPLQTDHLIRHLDAAYNLARWLVRNETEAEDLVQEACLRAVRSFHTLREGESRPWLLSIVRNVCYDWLKRCRQMPCAEKLPYELEAIQSAGPSPEAILLRKGGSEAVREALGSLPHHLREVIILREFEELSYKEIASILEVPRGTVMSRLSRARRQLQQWQGPQSRTAAGMA
jgi:RNA polymerase sigma-70 factor (ECF subfamily)